jgi:hypothetical protein
MAGIGQEPDVQLRPELSTNRTPIDFNVEQNAVSQLSDAFRKGVITADDLIERYGTLAKTKEKAQIQGLDEFLSPEAIQARQQQTALMGSKAKQEIALAPAEEAAKKATYEATRIAAEQGDNASVRKIAIENGFGGNLSPYSAVNKDQDLKAYQDAVAYKAAVSGAIELGKDVDRREHVQDVTKGGIQTITKDSSKDTLASKTSGHDYTKEETGKAAALARMTPQQWIAEGRPTLGQYVYGVKPPEQPANKPDKVVQPVSELVTPRVTTETTTYGADGSRTVTKKVVDPTEHPDLPLPDTVTTSKEVDKPMTADDKGKILGQVRVADEMADKINAAQAIVHDAALQAVGPGALQGTRIAQTLNKVGAAFGSDIAVKKAEAQNQLDQFIAQSIQNTIRSMAGSGNRVMQAEIDPHTGLFTRANPTMSSTPATWDKWFGEMRDLFSRAREDSVSLLPDELKGNVPKAPVPVIPKGTETNTSVTTAPKVANIPGIGKGHYDPVKKKFIVE